jgi:hypothetical protein
MALDLRLGRGDRHQRLRGVEHLGTIPESVKLYARWPPLLWYVVVVPSMAVTAVVVSLFGLVSRTAPPWTHSLAVALILWPLVPLAGVLALTRFA